MQHISPFLEPSGSGITSLWARTVALKFESTVIVGYPEKVDVASRWPTGPEYYNSAIVINEDGDTIANCRKTFLYPTDETWALEGEGFHDGFLPNAGQTAIGICRFFFHPCNYRWSRRQLLISSSTQRRISSKTDVPAMPTIL